MAYDQALAARIRSHLAHRAGVTEKQMFGGVAFMLEGHMAVGVHKNELVVRLAASQHAAAVAEPHAHAMTFTGRSMPGFILVGPDGIVSDAALGTWIDRAVAHAATLRPKQPTKAKKSATRARKLPVKAARKAARKPARKAPARKAPAKRKKR